ncbi:GNAT family N-acetyltransferase [Butyrivibrio sp. INlla14]|uniref:GNAT family N-acetyltransferase n=1 Tax=Butyrivibrio sp. INlla14 TaxID=1520808 RepID=UPI000876AA9C|nr:GNAT family protein [Butyrivibrio sp. INlla14]SCY25683.1 Protein N-acetyltransferase, RimJ/RimL family [Butyrivibrio sp. INlla14]
MNEKIIKTGEQVCLRLITSEDTELIVKWRNNERVRQNFVYRVPFTREIHENWLQTQVFAGRVVQMIICEKNNGNRPVGSVYLKYITEDKSEAEYGVFIGEDDATGKGYGNETARLAVEYARDLGLKRLILRAFSYNSVAIKSYENAGFREYQKLPMVECSDGIKSDMILMENLLQTERANS